MAFLVYVRSASPDDGIEDELAERVDVLRRRVPTGRYPIGSPECLWAEHVTVARVRAGKTGRTLSTELLARRSLVRVPGTVVVPVAMVVVMSVVHCEVK